MRDVDTCSLHIVENLFLKLTGCASVVTCLTFAFVASVKINLK